MDKNNKDRENKNFLLCVKSTFAYINYYNTALVNFYTYNSNFSFITQELFTKKPGHVQTGRDEFVFSFISYS